MRTSLKKKAGDRNVERTRRKRRRRVRWGRVFFALLFLFIIVGGIYSYFQYKQGLSMASDGKFADDGTTFEQFQGSLPNNGEVNMLLLGSDSRGEKHSRTDSILIAHYDSKSKHPKIVSLMRDMYVDIPGHGKQKLNAAYAFGGPELLRQTIKQNFDIDINYYAVVDFEGFSKIVDTIAPDGIEVTVPHDMSSGIGMTLHKGTQVLHGEQLLGYVRFRHDNMSDFGRVQRQQEVVLKLKDEVASLNSVFKIPKLLGVMDPYIDTNLDTKSMMLLAKDVVTGNMKDVQSLRLPLDGSFENKTYSGVGMVLDIDLDKNKEALHEFLNDK
ncbi:LCP family protein [Priestia megaterium]|uniref:LCP family protein n=1 Tax=Priestia megaterium TaxID=1404 RepID=UPI003704C433